MTGITAVVPETCINIDDEVAFFNNDRALLDRNKKILGLGTRHVVEDGVAVSDLLAAAADRLFEDVKCDRSAVDALIVVTSSPDYHYPATACILQHRLGLSEECSCFDLGGLACSAYVHGMWLAHSLVESGAARHCLVLAGDITSTHSDRRNRNSNMLFGDAGTATLVERTEDACPAWFITGTRGSGWDTLIAPAGGYALPVRGDIADLEVKDETGNVWRMYDDIMKGMSVFKFTTDVGPRGIADILAMSGKTKDDVDYFAIHQANKHRFVVRCIDPVEQFLFSLSRIFAALLRIAQNKLRFARGNIEIVQHSLNIFIPGVPDQRISAVFQQKTNIPNHHLKSLLLPCPSDEHFHIPPECLKT